MIGWMNEGKTPQLEVNQGDEVGGIVAKVGEGVTEFRPGDRVGGFHGILHPHGTHGEYTILEEFAAFHLPENAGFEGESCMPPLWGVRSDPSVVSDCSYRPPRSRLGADFPQQQLTWRTEAATIGLVAGCAFLVLYHALALPSPWTPATDSIPLVIYGAGTAVGNYAIQFAKRSNIHPLICVAGKTCASVEAILDSGKGDVVLDYRIGHDKLAAAIAKAANGREIKHAFDVICGSGSYITLSKVLADQGSLITILPFTDFPGMGAHVKHQDRDTFELHADARELAYVYFRCISLGLKDGWFKPQRYEVLPGGLEGIQQGLRNLKNWKASGIKYVYRVGEP
jgi:NADPH:quinone reductase